MVMTNIVCNNHYMVTAREVVLVSSADAAVIVDRSSTTTISNANIPREEATVTTRWGAAFIESTGSDKG